MKLIVSTIFVLASAFAFANEHGAAGGAAAAPKMGKKEAKAACKAEGKKGKELKSCMKEKMM